MTSDVLLKRGNNKMDHLYGQLYDIIYYIYLFMVENKDELIVHLTSKLFRL